MSYIVSTATAFPPHYYQQEEILAWLSDLWSGQESRIARLEQFHRNAMVSGRHLALPIDKYADLRGFGEKNDAWIEAALDLGEKVICKLLDAAGLTSGDIQQLLFTTVTGIAVPSIDARLMNRIPFSTTLKRVPLFGLGCMGGAAGIARQADYLHGHQQDAAVLLSIELCSLTLQHDDLTAANMVSSSLFGDGAAAVLMVGDEHPLAREGMARVIDSQSVFFPRTEYIMGWEVRDSGLKMLLSSDVAEIVQNNLLPPMEAFLARHGLQVSNVDHWIVHPGGPRVIEAMEQALALRPDALDITRKSLRTVGNLSSASVLSVLDETLRTCQPPAGSNGLILAMGPAFSAEMVLVRW